MSKAWNVIGERLTVTTNCKDGTIAITKDAFDDYIHKFYDRDLSHNHNQHDKHHRYSGRQNFNDDYDDDGMREKAKSVGMLSHPRGHAVNQMQLAFDDDVKEIVIMTI